MKNIKNKEIIIWVLVLILAAWLRLAGIFNVTQGFYVDEASIAYNSLSVGNTLRDEYGQILPVAFRSFGDFKPPLLEYASIPLVLLLGPLIGVRLTNAILGILTVFLVGVTAKKIFKRWEVGVLSALFLAIDPWQINLSRHAIESVIGALFFAIALLFFTKQKLWWALSTLAIATLTYHAERYLSPILAVAMIYLAFKKNWFKLKRFWWLTIPLWIGAILIMVQPCVSARPGGVSVFDSYQGIKLVRHLMSAYMSYFSPWTLVKGDFQPRNNIFMVTNMWLLTLICFYVGLIKVLRSWKETQWKLNNQLLIVFLLLISPLPAIAAIDPFQTIRSMQMVLPISILAGWGGWKIFEYFKTKWVKIAFSFGLVIYVLYNSFLLTERMLVQNTIFAYDSWNTGYQELIEKTMKIKTDIYDQIVVDNTDEPATYSLWQVFGEISTSEKAPLMVGDKYYQPIIWKTPTPLKIKTGQVINIRNIYWPLDRKNPNTLYIGPKKRFDDKALINAGAIIVDVVKDPRGEVKWMMVATSKEEPN